MNTDHSCRMFRLPPLILVLICSCQSRIGDVRYCDLNDPFLEWSLSDPRLEGNPYDIHALARFTHETGAEKSSLMYYSPGDACWKFRFTGTIAGRWRFATEGPGRLGEFKGEVIVEENSAIERRNGFLTARGQNWIWEGSGRATIPQLVMLEDPARFFRNGQVDTALVRKTVTTFIREHGFTGFHLEGGGYWYDINTPHLGSKGDPVWADSRCIPDERTMEVYETLILECSRQGACCYLWLWGSDNSGSPRAGPELIGGHMSGPYKRLCRYIAARLGPLPGWFMGYGFDLERWLGDDFSDGKGDLVTAAKRLEEWKDTFEIYLGGWEHLLGGRAHPVIWTDYPKYQAPPDSIFWYGDFASYVNFRPAYAMYRKNMLAAPDVPNFQGDRFRIRERERYGPKDYTHPDMVIRGLWHSTMAGGVGNIWGNLTVPGGVFDDGTVFGQPVRIREQIRTWNRFWMEGRRWMPGMQVVNVDEEAAQGREMILPEGGGSVFTALKDPETGRLIIYAENTDRIRIPEPASEENLSFIAVDTKAAYLELPITPVSQGRAYGGSGAFLWNAPRVSNWAIAIEKAQYQ